MEIFEDGIMMMGVQDGNGMEIRPLAQLKILNSVFTMIKRKHGMILHLPTQIT